MKNTPLSKTAFCGFIFHLIALVILIFSRLPSPPASPLPGFIFNSLLAGKSPFTPFGSEFSVFKPLLPPFEKVSFIMDYPFTPYVTNIDQFYTAQSYLAPTILSHDPDQRAAIVYYSTTKIAQRRLEETGYRILIPLSEGKGIAVKK